LSGRGIASALPVSGFPGGHDLYPGLAFAYLELGLASFQQRIGGEQQEERREDVHLQTLHLPLKEAWHDYLIFSLIVPASPPCHRGQGFIPSTCHTRLGASFIHSPSGNLTGLRAALTVCLFDFVCLYYYYFGLAGGHY
jgi:hypothetical protein